jgi:inhibitor of cysteine peptidase
MSDPIVTITEADAGTTVKLQVGQAVAVRLSENASTGYRWAIDAADAKLVTPSEPQLPYQSGAVGSGRLVPWTFTARSPGATTVTLKLWRHWEGDASIIQRFRFELIITP